ncbi:MAG: glycosyltransferase, partial [candidate division Zixibacteria bacterium]|nr:glycosyltransferase [candidate division Zixibacteria bacterium]
MKILYLNYSNSTVQLMRISDVARGLRLQDHQVDLIHMDRNVQAQLRRAQKQSTDAYATTKKHLSFSRFLPRFLAVLAGEPKRFYYNLRMFFDELRILRKSDHDFVLVRPGICWSIFVSTYLLKKKVVYDTDGPLLEAYQSPNCNLPKHYLKMEDFWVKQWKAMSVISNEMKRHYQAKGGDPNRIFLMPNGINSEIFHPEVDASEIKKRYKLEDKLVIGFMGNLESWHGLPGLLQVFPNLAERYENLRMLLVGFHLDWDNLAESADKRFLKYKDRVICTGR